MLTLADIEAALPIVRAAVPPTPQYAWPLLKARTGVEVVVKHENHTPIGAFKVRGGLVYFDRLKRERPHVKGAIGATRGNHGQSLAYAGARAGVPVAIGLGSGICGVIGVRDVLQLKTKVVGVVSDAANAYSLSLQAGRVIGTNAARTFADGMAVRGPDATALDVIRRGAERIVEVSDD